jgi:pimeloyl-ACP methyl ester carboxylesterase
MAALADALGLGRFSLLGVSGGAPYALACALSMPERVDRLAMVCGLGPLNPAGATRGMGRVPATFVACARRWPRIATAVYAHLVGPLMYHVPWLVTRILSSAAPEADRAVINRPEQQRMQWASYREAFRGGGRGPAWDLRLYTQPWRLEPARLAVRTWLWHGEADRTVPVAMGRAYAGQIPGCRALFFPGEGHFSLTANHAGEILSVLAAGSAAARPESPAACCSMA